MKVQNHRSLLAKSSDLMERTLENDIDLNALGSALKIYELQLRSYELAHKQTVANCMYDNYEKNWGRWTPQSANVDDLK